MMPDNPDRPHGGGVRQVADGVRNGSNTGIGRRAEDGFHFEPVRQIARRRTGRRGQGVRDAGGGAGRGYRA